MTTTPSETLFGRDLLHAVMDQILAHPDQWDQRQWATRTECGTAYCFAGWACALNGLQAHQVDLAIEGRTASLSDERFIEDVARDLLGIGSVDSGYLFHTDNTMADLKHYVDQIDEHGRILEPIHH